MRLRDGLAMAIDTIPRIGLSGAVPFSRWWSGAF
jgi:hypothetical protein